MSGEPAQSAQPEKDLWQRQAFRIATESGPLIREGWGYRGLGLYINGPNWQLVHLNTGHEVVTLVGDLTKSKAVGFALAEAIAWEDFGLDFGNIEPELEEKIITILKKFYSSAERTKPANPDHEQAAAIAAEREG